MIIGLSGYARSGKDTVADILVMEHGYTRVAFADAVRNFSLAIDPLIDQSLRLSDVVNEYGWDAAKSKIEVRRTLQAVGLAAREQFGELFWVKMALNSVSYTGNYVITDVRFKNEAEHIKQRDYAQIWRIERPGVGPINDHISEIDMDDWNYDHIFNNDKSLDELHAAVEEQVSKSV